MLNKSLTTNLAALAIICASYLSPKYKEIIYLTGLFALSGGITNWLAIHMLFEKKNAILLWLWGDPKQI